MNKEKIIESINKIKNELNLIINELNVFQTNESEFEKLKNLLSSNNWPESVLDFQIVDENSQEEKMDRAEGIVDILIDEELKDKKFLDFGCGEGHMAKYASIQETLLSVGYDIKKSNTSQFTWELEEDNLFLTTSIEKVKEKGPYDIILIYDIIDHTENPKELLIQAKSLLSDNGKIYLRCHPWCGRHGGHLYRKLNKAFVHVVFSDEELEKMGLRTEEPNIKVKLPMKTYEEYIKDANLKIESKDIETQDVEEFFEKDPIISNRLKEAIGADGGKTFPRHQLSQCFHDYILTK